jgi:hypothetical protein
MQWRGVFAVAVVVGAAAWFGGRAVSDEKEPTEEEKAAWEAQAKPGPLHEWLAKANGTWSVTGTINMGAPTPVTGTATFTSVLGGRWQQQDFDVQFGDKPFQGLGLTGYDNAKKEFLAYWWDTWSTGGAPPATGQLSEDKKVLTTKGEWEMGDEKVAYRHVLTFVSDKETRFQGFHTHGGEEGLMIELTYTRK